MTGAGYQLNIDMDQLLDTPTGTASFQNLNPIQVDSALNEAVDTFFRLGDSSYATNILTGFDPEFSVTAKSETSTANSVVYALYRARFDLAKRNRASFQIVDNYSGETITFNGTITAISDARTVEADTEISFSFKFRGAPTITTG